MNKINHFPVSTPPSFGHNVYSGNCLNKHNILCAPSLRLDPQLTPVNTGKILIGAAYVPAKNHVHDDQLWLQSTMLPKPGEQIHPSPLPLTDKIILVLFVVSCLVIWLTA